MELARKAPALELLSLDDPAQRIACNALGKVNCECGPGGEGLGESDIGVREAHVAAELVVRCEHADRAAADEQRHPKARASAHQARGLVVHVGVVEQRVHTLALASLEHAPRLRCRPGNRLPEDLLASDARNRGET